MAGAGDTEGQSRAIDLAGRVAIITGAGRGIGRAVALEFGRLGARVVLAARTGSEIEAAAEAIRRAGGQAIAVPTDVTAPDQVDRLARHALEAFGRVDVLVNNAADAGGLGRFWEADPAEWQRAFDANVMGALLCARAVVPGMIARRAGKIINVGSGAGLRPLAYYSSYCAAKAALMHLTRCMAEELKPYGVNVNAVGVSADTALLRQHLANAYAAGMPEREVGSLPAPEENVGAFVFLASPASDHVTGQYFEANSLPSTARTATVD